MSPANVAVPPSATVNTAVPLSCASKIFPVEVELLTARAVEEPVVLPRTVVVVALIPNALRPSVSW